MYFKLWLETNEFLSPNLFKSLNKLKHPLGGVHFSKSNFLHFNVNPNHNDPVGVYSFPKQYVLNQHLFDNQGFASYPYVFLVEPTSSAKILNLDMSLETAKSILIQMKINPNLTNFYKTPGHSFWNTLKSVTQYNSHWNNLFKLIQ